MMTETRDPALESLFLEATEELDGEAITSEVMINTRVRLVRMVAGGALAIITVLLISWYVFAGPLLDFAVLLSNFLTSPIARLDEGWLALLLTPINNLASLTLITAKVSLVAWKRLTGTALIR